MCSLTVEAMEIEGVRVNLKPQFDEDAVKYALRVVGSPDLVLKLKQLETIFARVTR